MAGIAYTTQEALEKSIVKKIFKNTKNLVTATNAQQAFLDVVTTLWNKIGSGTNMFMDSAPYINSSTIINSDNSFVSTIKVTNTALPSLGTITLGETASIKWLPKELGTFCKVESIVQVCEDSVEITDFNHCYLTFNKLMNQEDDDEQVSLTRGLKGRAVVITSDDGNTRDILQDSGWYITSLPSSNVYDNSRTLLELAQQDLTVKFSINRSGIDLVNESKTTITIKGQII